MNAIDVIALVVTALLGLYLLVYMLIPEKSS